MVVLIEPADLDDARVAKFLADHLADMAPTAPAESQHGLALDELRGPETQVWTAMQDGDVVGTVALIRLDAHRSELKSMRSDPRLRGQGIGRALLNHAIADARSQGVLEILLETGTQPFYAASRGLYHRAGFRECAPFGGYRVDANSVYLALSLGPLPRGSLA